MAAGAKKLSNACIIRQLQSEYDQKLAEFSSLSQENQSLRSREEVLLQQVTQQGDNLHFVALAAAQTSPDSPDLAKTLIHDLEVYELLGLLGRKAHSGDGSGGEAEPFTTQRLRAAVTPQRVAAMCSITVEEVAAQLKQLTMRMCMLLAGGADKAAFFRDSMQAVVDEYGEFGLLLHVAADWVNLQIGTMNLDTLEVQEPPPGYWENVVDHLELQKAQVQTLATGFNRYQHKSKPIIAALHSSVSSIRALLDCDGEPSVSTGPQPSDVTSTRPGDTFWHFLHNTLLEQPSPANGSSTPTQALPAAAAGADAGLSADGPVKQARPPPPPQQQQQQGGAPSQPWQQIGLSQGCLTVETVEELEQHMTALMQNVMKLREMHRTVTWLFLNTLNARQHCLFITGSWPWWSRPLTMCQYIAEQHQQQHPCQRQSSGTSNSDSPSMPPGAFGAAAAAAVADGVWHMTLGSAGPRQHSSGAPRTSTGVGTGAAHLPAPRGKHAGGPGCS